MTLALLLTILVCLIANMVMTYGVLHRLETVNDAPPQRRSLPCAAIPTKLILEDPACADKLIRAMNVTNVHVSNHSQKWRVK